jgi:hypothetical protein
VETPAPLGGSRNIPFGHAFYCNAEIFFQRSNLDTEGEELRDKHAAWQEATIIAGELLRDINGKLKPGQDLQLEVTDEFRNRLYMIRVSAEESI